MPKNTIFAILATSILTWFSPSLVKAGYLVGWGNNGFGQIEVPADDDFVAVAAGEAHSLALREDGSLVALGYGKEKAPVEKKFRFISAYGRYSLGVTTDGQLVGWSYDKKALPFPDRNDFVLVAAGEDGFTALKSNGTAVTYNYHGGKEKTPDIDDFVDVTAWQRAFAGVRKNGEVKLWGSTSLEWYKNCPEDGDYVAITPAGYALKSDGTLIPWRERKAVREPRNIPPPPVRNPRGTGRGAGLMVLSRGDSPRWKVNRLARGAAGDLLIRADGGLGQGSKSMPEGTDYLEAAGSEWHGLAIAENPGPREVRQPVRENQLVAANLTAKVAENGSVTVSLIEKEAESGAPERKYSVLHPPRHGKAEVKNGAELTYEPEPGYSGPEMMTYWFYGGGASSLPGCVAIMVEGKNDQPYPQDLKVVVGADEEVELKLRGFDPDGDDLSYTLGSKPGHGSLELLDQKTQCYRYRPVKNYTGTDEFEFTVTDGQVSSEPGRVEITVTGETMDYPTLDDQIQAVVRTEKKIYQPMDVVAEKENIIILSNHGQMGEVVICDPNLGEKKRFPLAAHDPHGIAIGKEGKEIYITDTAGGRILKYDANGALDINFKTDFKGKLVRPWGIGVLEGDRWGEKKPDLIFVSDAERKIIVVFDENGVWQEDCEQSTWEDRQWGTKGPVLVAEEKATDERMLSDGKVITKRPVDGVVSALQLKRADRQPWELPAGLSIQPNGYKSSEIFLTDSKAGTVKRLNESGSLTACTRGLQKGQALAGPADAATDREYEQLVIADSKNNRIVIFQLASGEFRSAKMMYVQEIADAGLNGPLGVAVRSDDKQQFIYVADTGNNRVVKLENQIYREGKSPEDFWKRFRAALATEDPNAVLPMISFWAQEKYAEILPQLKPHMKQMAEEMKVLELESRDAWKANYELIVPDKNGGLAAYPLHFSRGEKGEWRVDGL